MTPQQKPSRKAHHRPSRSKGHRPIPKPVIIDETWPEPPLAVSPEKIAEAYARFFMGHRSPLEMTEESSGMADKAIDVAQDKHPWYKTNWGPY